MYKLVAGRHNKELMNSIRTKLLEESQGSSQSLLKRYLTNNYFSVFSEIEAVIHYNILAEKSINFGSTYEGDVQALEKVENDYYSSALSDRGDRMANQRLRLIFRAAVMQKMVPLGHLKDLYARINAILVNLVPDDDEED